MPSSAPGRQALDSSHSPLPSSSTSIDPTDIPDRSQRPRAAGQRPRQRWPWLRSHFLFHRSHLLIEEPENLGRYSASHTAHRNTYDETENIKRHHFLLCNIRAFEVIFATLSAFAWPRQD